MSELESEARALFLELVDLDAAQRAASLASQDPAVARRVQGLLDADAWQQGSPSSVPAWAQVQGSSVLLAPGQAVDRYETVERLGLGGMAEVWRVRHRQLGTQHALKILLWSTPDMFRRIRAEAEVMRKLCHPHVLAVTGVINVMGAPALLMPFVDGPTLGTVLRRRRLPRDVALAVFSAVLDGVVHVHEAGVVHRDLKPDNILLDLQRGSVVPCVADFGLVKELGGARQTAHGVPLGTLPYAAPEQLEDASSAGLAADVFSLGVILVELLTGEVPFDGGTVADVRRAVLQGPDLTGVGPLEGLIGAMLSIRPNDRPDVATVRASLPSDQAPLASTAVVAAVREATRRTPAAAGTLGLPPSNAPRARNAFVGRGDELAMLRTRLVGARLVTVTGPGGIGKTRLVQELATAVRPDTDGVWWVDLSDAQTRDAALATVAKTLGVRLDPQVPAQLGEALAQRGRCLVVFDNLEQLADVLNPDLGEWLDVAEQARFVVTSRVRLGVTGEQMFTLGGLDEPAAVELFAVRASELQPGFDLTAHRLRVVSLTSLLDHMPLAIELAASRIRTMDPDTLIDRLRDRFRLLRSTSSTGPARHRTLEATLAWSWNLLTPVQQRVLAQLSVFEGGFTVRAAEAVVSLEDLDDPPWLEDVFEELVDRSLVVSALGSRMHLLVSVQAFARERLPNADGVYARHAAWFAWLGAPERLNGLVHPADRAHLGELDNLRVAMEWTRDHDHPLLGRLGLAYGNALIDIGSTPTSEETLLDIAVRTSGPEGERIRSVVGILRLDRGDHDGAAALVEPLLDHAIDPEARTRAANLMTLVRVRQGHPDHLGMARRAVHVATALGDRAVCRVVLGGELLRAGYRDEALEELSRGEHEARDSGATYAQIMAKGFLAQGFALAGRGDEAWATLREAEDLWHPGLPTRLRYRLRSFWLKLQAVLGDGGSEETEIETIVELRDFLASVGRPADAANLEGALARRLLTLERLDDAQAAYERANATHLRLGIRRGLPFWALGLGDVQRARGDLPGALVRYREALELSEGVREVRYLAAVLIAEILVQLGRPAEARACVETVEADLPDWHATGSPVARVASLKDAIATCESTANDL